MGTHSKRNLLPLCLSAASAAIGSISACGSTSPTACPARAARTRNSTTSSVRFQDRPRSSLSAFLCVYSLRLASRGCRLPARIAASQQLYWKHSLLIRLRESIQHCQKTSACSGRATKANILMMLAKEADLNATGQRECDSTVHASAHSICHRTKTTVRFR